MRCFKSLEKQKLKHKKGLWSPYEDQKLRDYILQYGHGCWSSVPINAGLERNGKSCRLRWINYLRPGLKRGMFCPQEEDTILTLHAMFGNKWSQIAQHLPGRTDNEIKNYWHSYLKKRLAKKSEQETKTEFLIPKTQSSSFSSQKSSTTSTTTTTRNQSFESFEHIAGLEQPTDPIGQSNLPRLLFTEWLSLDQFQGQLEFGNSSSEPAVSKDEIDRANQDCFISSLLLDEGSSGNNGFHQQELRNGPSMEDMFQMGNGYVNFMEDDDDEMYNHFNMSNDWTN